MRARTSSSTRPACDGTSAPNCGRSRGSEAARHTSCTARRRWRPGASASRARDEGRDASEADVALLDRQAGYWEPFEDGERDVVIDIDTTKANPDVEALECLRAIAPHT